MIRFHVIEANVPECRPCQCIMTGLFNKIVKNNTDIHNFVTPKKSNGKK